MAQTSSTNYSRLKVKCWTNNSANYIKAFIRTYATITNTDSPNDIKGAIKNVCHHVDTVNTLISHVNASNRFYYMLLSYSTSK